MKDRKCIVGEIFSEVVDFNGEEYEHIGFRDPDGEFGNLLEKLLGEKVRICIEIIEDK